MESCCVRDEVELGDLADPSSDLTVAVTGTAIAIACVACVLWTLSNDQALQSELAAEGASQVIDPAEAPRLVQPPNVSIPRALLTLDQGMNAAATPVVNAHLEIVGDGESSRTVDVSSMVRQLVFERRGSSDRSARPIGAWLAGEVETNEPASTSAAKAGSTAGR
ncbi:MAG: hypothetical protein WBC44_13725 [Planctomycetaceae bacterium]